MTWVSTNVYELMKTAIIIIWFLKWEEHLRLLVNAVKISCVFGLPVLYILCVSVSV